MLALRVRTRTAGGRAGGLIGDAKFERDLELLRAGYAAFQRGDLADALALLAPEFVLEVHTGRADLPELPVYRGREGFLENWRHITEPFDEVRIELQAVEGTSERIIATILMSGRGKASQAPFEVHIYHAWTLRDGIALRLDIYSSMEDALAGGG